MISILKASHKLKETIFLGLMSVFCFLLTVFRVHYADSPVFFHLNWNLFLALVPWLLSSSLIVFPSLRSRRLLTAFILGLWLLFFPNALYIVTDLFHLKNRAPVPLWYDLILLISFAWLGLLYGYLSLLDVEKLMRPRLNTFWLKVTSFSLIFLASFGVYLGRYLRWNSWDILRDPASLFLDISDRFLDPLAHPRTWGMTILLGIFLSMAYTSLLLVKNRKETIVD